MNFIHFTKKFKAEIIGSQNKEILYKRLNDLEKCRDINNLNSIDSYRRNVFVYKLLKSFNSRVIIISKRHQIDNEEVSFLYVHEYVPKSSFAYKWGNVIHPSLVNGTWLDNNDVDEAEINNAIQKYKKSNSNIRKEKAPPPLEITKWLTKFSAEIKFDLFEYENWVKFSSNPNQKDGLEESYLILYKKLIEKIIQNDFSGCKKVKHSSNLFTIENTEDNIGIFYSTHKNILNDKTIYVLRDGANTIKQKEKWVNLIQELKEERIPYEGTLDEISKKAFRAYPKWILHDKEYDLWQIIQRYKGNYNLSLLPEQIDFLNEFKFPTYINGQAGSGKSTMLYYLYANVFSHKIAGEFNGDTIFLTENKSLIEDTKKAVTGLLASNPDFHFALTIEQQGDIKNSFSSFTSFLLEMLPNDLKESYHESKFMDFAKFKSLYRKNYNTSYSAEEAWFVINTFVIGYDEHEIIDTREKYESQVVRDFQVVTPYTFEKIVNDIYLGIYKRLITEDKYWTRTLLARKIHELYPHELPNNYYAVFCDEAQDFTRVELRLIIYSSIFMKYDLSNEGQIPIVFAGDALQTVSPNRFTVKRLKQMYYSIFEESNFDYNASVQKRSIYTPEYNYRSNQPIVRIANIIQQFRSEYLSEDMYVKQVSKRSDNIDIKPMIHCFDWLSKSENFNTFLEKFKHKSFIIPTDLNEEKSYWESQSLLSKKNPYFTDIKSSISAKGAEYSQVVVYGFGDNYYNEFGTLTNSISEDDKYKQKFFFNKLYVAITRAQNELIIIDSRIGIDNFWIPLLKTMQNLPTSWELYQEIDDIIWIEPNTGLKNVFESTREDALENAKKDKEQGIIDGNSTRLMVAANTFLILDCPNQAYECHAHSSFIKGNFEKAGDQFKKANNLTKAAEAYFLGEKWDRIPREVEGIHHQVRLSIAKFMKSGYWSDNELLRAFDLREEFYEVLKNIEWYSKLSNLLIKYTKKENQKIEKKDLALILESIVRESDHELLSSIADLYFSTQQFSKAIKTWDKYIFNSTSKSLPKDYIISNINISRDEKNKNELILWTGRLLVIYIDENNREEYIKQVILIKDLLNKLPNETELFCDDNVLEIEEYKLYIDIISGINSQIHILTSSIESKSVSHKKLLQILIRCINVSSSEEIAIFFKQRWAYVWYKNDKTDESEEKIKNLNNAFNSYRFRFENTNFDWTIEELKELPSIPEKILMHPPLHLKNIRIQNYKRFDSIELKNLGNFNIILGDNNTGKTTLIESLMFSHNPDQEAKYLLNIEKFRDNNICHNVENKRFLLDSFIKQSFSTKNSIIYTIMDGRRRWQYAIEHPNSEYLRNVLKVDTSNPADYLLINKDDESFLSENLSIIDKVLTLGDIQFIPFGKGSLEDIYERYFNLVGKDRSERIAFNKYLELFIPGILDIVKDPHSNGVLIEQKSDKEGKYLTLPLQSFGDGANKLFQILLSLYASKDSRMMIDEIDAGIHYSRFKEFWSTIIHTASELNVQLFITTHNEECIQEFYKLFLEENFENLKNKARIITLEKAKNSKIIPIIRDYDSMHFAFSNKIDLRGKEI